MEPPAGGVSYENAKISLEYSYFENGGAKFISFPPHIKVILQFKKKENQIIFKLFFYVSDSGYTNETSKIFELLDDTYV